MKLWDPNQQVNEKKLSHILLHAFYLHFLRIHTKTFWKFLSTTYFRKYKWKVVIYPFNYDSSKSFFFMLNMAFDVLLSTVSCNIKITRTSRWVFWYVFFYKNLIVLQHGYNNFLFYFDICIKFILLTKISTMKKSHLMRVMKQQ